MIKQLIKMLSIDDFYEGNELVQFAKGKYKYPETWSEVKKSIKREIKTSK